MKIAIAPVYWISLIASSVLHAQTLPLPPRSAFAMSGSQFAKSIESQELKPREEKIFSEIMAGNVPEFWRKLSPIVATAVTNQKTNTATYFVTPDYLAVGSTEDYFYTPLTPFTAQKLADALDCILPTRKMVNEIFSNAVVKLPPSPISPTPAMTTVSIFRQHNDTVRQQLVVLTNLPLGALTAGSKKDLVISSRLINLPDKVAIYGWHRTNGFPIQPLYLGHAASWVDYSHGIRFVQKNLLLNGEPKNIESILADPGLASLLSDEGVITQPKYIFSKFPALPTATNAINVSSTNKAVVGQFQKSPRFNEQTLWLLMENGVRILVNAPSAETFSAPKKTKLILYGLPNGNTIEHTVGKLTATNEDWHFDIQHIGAQTRFLREHLPNENIVIAYLENSLKSWPAWRKQFGDKAVLEIVDKVVGRFEAFAPKIILTGHSGGGSFTFGYLSCVEKIPDNVERIAFLDSNYGYESVLHASKFALWLKNSNEHFLTVLAYHDAVALLNGKTFVSAAGGTWGKSHLMKKDFESEFKFEEKDVSENLKSFSTLSGRVQFFLKENPEKKIFHTVQVEKNGFIHAMLTGTSSENKGYEYFGDRAYSKWISSE